MIWPLPALDPPEPDEDDTLPAWMNWPLTIDDVVKPTNERSAELPKGFEPMEDVVDRRVKRWGV